MSNLHQIYPPNHLFLLAAVILGPLIIFMISTTTNLAPSVPQPVGAYTAETNPLVEVSPNSFPKVPTENHHNPSSSDGRSLFDMKREVDNLVREWEQLGKVPVSRGEKAKFLREYVRIGGHEIHFMEKLLPIASDPYIASRAGSINFLFSGINCALRNRDEIVCRATQDLNQVETQSDLDVLLSRIPGFIKEKSHNFGAVSDVIVKHLLQEPINSAKSRLGLACNPLLPRSGAELKSEIKRVVQEGATEQQLRELAIIEGAISQLSFGHCLELYSRYRQKHHATEAIP